MDQPGKVIKVMRALGDETRFQIINLLLNNDLCVRALANILNISPPAVSQQLRVLREAGLIRGEKRGYWMHYQVQIERLRDAVRYLQELSRARADTAATFFCLREMRKRTKSERRVLPMCKNSCEHPGQLKVKPSECTPEQIKECHGEGKGHSCESSCEQPGELGLKAPKCGAKQIKECQCNSKDHPVD